MPATKIIPIPAEKALEKLGEDIKQARIRRCITMDLMAQRAGITRATLSRVEKGDSATSMGIYAKVLFILSLHENLADIADIKNDATSRILAAKSLPKRVHLTVKKGFFDEL